MSTQRRPLGRVAAWGAIAIAIVVGAPALLVAASRARLGSASPLAGMNPPWEWRGSDVRSWLDTLFGGIDTSAELIDLFIRLGLLVAWVCVAVLIYTIVTEVAFQLRHGMPSHRRGRSGVLGVIGRKIATGLIAAVPLVVASTPSLVTAEPPASTSLPAVSWPHTAQPVEVSTPAGPSVTVEPGDSVWSIAERVDPGGDVAGTAQRIVEMNLGRVMNDGQTFSTAALIMPGWQLAVPAPTTPPPPATATPAAPATTDVASTHQVQPGDSYWAIAEQQLGDDATSTAIYDYTIDLIEHNAPLLGYDDPAMLHPGDIVALRADDATETAAPTDAPADNAPPAAPTVDTALPPPLVQPADAAVPPLDPIDIPSPAPPLPPPTTAAAVPATTAAPAPAPTPAGVISAPSRESAPITVGLGGAALLGVGALGVLHSRRRQQLRRAAVHARFRGADPEVSATESALRSNSFAERCARLDACLRVAAGPIATAGSRVIAVIAEARGDIVVILDQPVPSPADGLFVAGSSPERWTLPATAALEDVALAASGHMQPCPLLTHLGEHDDGALFVDLEALGVLCVEGSDAHRAAIIRSIAASAALSPFAESVRVLTTLQEPTVEGTETVPSPEGALADAMETLGSTRAASRETSTFALRATGMGGDAWEPVVVITPGALSEEFKAHGAALGDGGRGLAIVVDDPLSPTSCRLTPEDGGYVLHPYGLSVRPVGLLVEHVVAVQTMLESADEILESPATMPEVAPFEDPTPFVEVEHALVVRTMGQVDVIARSGESAGFERSKALELVVWLAHHRDNPSRSVARAALWETDVRDTTFHNVVSDARRAMGRLVSPPPDEEWIGRTTVDHLPVHPLLVTDVELLEARLGYVRSLPALDVVEVLRPGVELIGGLPFAGTSYLWPDAEGLSSSITLTATSAATILAQAYLSLGDIDGVFWATGQGLRVLSGHEELIGLRMRAHAQAGDLAGVRREWETYERALLADPWTSGEPSPKLVALRHELIAPSLAAGS